MENQESTPLSRESQELVPHLEFPKGKEVLPAEIKTIFWDVDGTITEKDKVDKGLAQILVETAANGLNHHFITGRDRFWLQEHLIPPLKKAALGLGYDPENILKKMAFWAEVGIIALDPVKDQGQIFKELENHPLITERERENRQSVYPSRTRSNLLPKRRCYS